MSLIDFLDSIEPRIMDAIEKQQLFPCEIPVFHSLDLIEQAFQHNPSWNQYVTIAAVFRDYHQIWIKFRVKLRRQSMSESTRWLSNSSSECNKDNHSMLIPEPDILTL